MKIANSIAAVLVLFFVAHSAHALDPNQPFSNYIRTRFNNEETSEIVNEIGQSADGFLWVLFSSGDIARFDGQRFTALPVWHPKSMAIGPNGDLWVGGGPELKQIPAAALTQYGPLQASTYNIGYSVDVVMFCLHFTRSGVLWVGTNVGLYRFEGGKFVPVIPKVWIRQIEESANGDLLLSTSDGFKVWNGSRAIPQPELANQLGVKPDQIFHVFEDHRGVTWICTGFGVARRFGNSIEKLQPWGPEKHQATRIYEDAQGTVWIAGDDGLFRSTAAGLELVVKGMQVRCMFGDRDGNLWVGTNGDGLFRFKDPAVRMFTTADGLPSNVPQTVLTSHDGTLWIGFNCGGLVRFDGQHFRTYNEKDGLLNSCVYSLAEDANHDLWIGTWGGGAFRFSNGSFTQYSTPQGLSGDVVLSILPARDGSVWIGTNPLSRLWPDGKVHIYTPADGIFTTQIHMLYEDRGGGIWVGTARGTYHLEGERFVKLSYIPDNYAWPLVEDSSGAMYVSLNDGGVFRVDNNRLIEVIPISVFTTYLRESREGDFWLSGEGVHRVPRASFERPRRQDEPADFEMYGVADGMASAQCSSGYPVSAFTPDGKLWVATVQGLAMLDVPHLPRTDRKPAIYMQQFTVGRNQQLPGQELVLSPGTSHIELRFDAVEITSPEKVRMQYRMDGVDSEWLDVTPPGHAVYSTLPPGMHAFHVRASNRDGIWDRTGIVYLIRQKPFFYQTTWFRVAMIGTGLLLVFGLYRLRLRQATEKINVRFDERLAERTRIARELHDTLLQTIQGSKLVADDALERATDFTHLHGKVQKLSQWLGQATEEGRAALNSLRTASVETNDLAVGLRRATEECSLIDQSIAVKFSITGSAKDLHPIVRDEVYRIGYEAIRNACEHSSATQLEVSLNYAQDLTLSVKDNGTGIEASVVTEGRPGHFGLQGMRERAQRISSKFTLNSTPNSGTELTLIVPGNVIFRKTTTTLFERIKTLFGLDNSTDLH